MSPEEATTADGAHATPTAWATDAGGLVIGPVDDPDRYELIGDGMPGGEGVTWRAQYTGQLANPLPVAIKVLHRQADADPEWPTEEDKARWRDQTALLRHNRIEHLVGLHEVFAAAPPHRRGQVDRSASLMAVIEMEWVEGPTLGSAVRGRPITRETLAERLRAIQDIASAVGQLHSSTRSVGNPIVHRDITPGNCIVTGDRGVVLIDVSTMQLPKDTVDAQGRHTPAYSAPEVLAAPWASRGPEADRYAVGAIAYFCVTGEDPPSGEADRRTELADAVREAGLDAALADRVLAMMQSDPAARPRELERWAAELQTAPRRRTGRTRRRAVVGGVAALVAVAAGIVVLPQVLHGAFAPAHASTTHIAAAAVTAVAGTARGTIDSPRAGSIVRDCSYFSGMVHIPADQTIVLSKVTLGTADTMHYVQFIFGWQKPFTSGRWRGAQFFNEASTDQTARVSLVEVPRKAAVAAHAADAVAQDRLVAHAPVLAHVDVTRGPGKDDVTTCDEP